MRRFRYAFSLVAALACASSTTAFAQSEAESRATARALGQQGQEAFDAKDFKKSEESFRRADALFHAPTLSLGLARSQAAQGKFVEAWENYNRIIIEGTTSTPTFAKALADAKTEIGAIEGRRSRVTVNVAGVASPRVSLDDQPLKTEALGIAFFVNPGTHTVLASADGFKPETRSFAVAEGKSETVSLSLQPAPEAQAATPGAALTASPAPVAFAPTASADTGTTGGANHVPAFVAFGVGGAGLITGVIAGVVAVGKHNTLNTECPSGTCGPAQQSDLDSYHTMGLVSTVGFVIAGAGAAAGVVLWIVAPKSSAHASGSAWIAPFVTPTGVGAVGGF